MRQTYQQKLASALQLLNQSNVENSQSDQQISNSQLQQSLLQPGQPQQPQMPNLSNQMPNQVNQMEADDEIQIFIRRPNNQEQNSNQNLNNVDNSQANNNGNQQQQEFQSATARRNQNQMIFNIDNPKNQASVISIANVGPNFAKNQINDFAVRILGQEDLQNIQNEKQEAMRQVNLSDQSKYFSSELNTNFFKSATQQKSFINFGEQTQEQSNSQVHVLSVSQQDQQNKQIFTSNINNNSSINAGNINNNNINNNNGNNNSNFVDKFLQSYRNSQPQNNNYQNANNFNPNNRGFNMMNNNNNYNRGFNNNNNMMNNNNSNNMMNNWNNNNNFNNQNNNQTNDSFLFKNEIKTLQISQIKAEGSEMQIEHNWNLNRFNVNIKEEAMMSEVNNDYFSEPQQNQSTTFQNFRLFQQQKQPLFQ